MNGRKRRIASMIVLALVLAMVPALSLADGTGVAITKVVQENNVLAVYLNMTDTTITPSDIPAKNFSLSVGGKTVTAHSVTPMRDARVFTNYTVLYCTAMDQNKNASAYRAAQNVAGARVRTAFTDKLNAPLMTALNNIGNSTGFDSPTERYAVIVITDRDAESLNKSVLESIEKKHIPVFTIFLGNGSAPNLQQYAVSGGLVFYSSMESCIGDVDQVQQLMNSAVILRFYPGINVFRQVDVSMTVTVTNGGKEMTSPAYRKKDLNPNVSGDTPTPTPTMAPSPTPTITPTPKPTPEPATVPPEETSTPEPTPEPTEDILVGPIAVIETPVPATPPPVTPTASPTYPPKSQTTPPVTPTVIPAPEPTVKPESNGFMEWIKDNLGEDGIWLVGAGALFILAVIILLIVFISSRKKKARGSELELQNLSFSSDEEGEATTYSKGSSEDAEATTYSKAPSSDAGIGSGIDVDKTTSPFSRSALDQLQDQQPMFGGAGEDGEFGDKTVAISSFGEDPDKTVRIQDNSGLKLKFTVDTNGTVNTYMAAVKHKIIVGRGKDCDVCISDNSVSKHHIEISYESDGLYVRDLGSSNGTLLNGDKVNSSTPLRTNDMLVLGFSKVTVEVLA